MFAINTREDSEKSEELASVQNQVQEVRLQDRLGEQNYHQTVQEIYEPLTDTITNTSENLTKTITEYYIINNKAIENLTTRVSELMNDKGVIAPFLASSMANLFKPENKRQFRFKKDPNSTQLKDFLISGGISVTLFGNMLIFRDSKKPFKLDGDLLETMTNYYGFNVSHSNTKDQKLISEFVEEMNPNIKQKGWKSDIDKSVIKLLKSPTIMAPGISTIFLPSDPNELCNKLKLLKLEKKAGNDSDLINKEIIAIVGIILECKCISKKQHTQVLIKCNLLQE